MKNLTSDRWLDQCLPQTQAALLAQGRSRRYGKGEGIHQIDDPATELFFIRSGAVRFGAVNKEGKALIVRDLTAGHWFGFIGCYGSGIRPNDASALTDTVLVHVPLSAVEVAGKADPLLWRAVSGVLAGYVGHFYKTYENAVFLPLEQRLRVALAQLCKWQATTTLSISQSELAALLGVTKEAVGVNLNLLKADGQVDLGYRSVRCLWLET
ncbi:Crp/Fnr family transcriptional regulator [Phaeobacter inhibens]|uniref:Crp/Fnr family transcriptional regulator n=1 Tax=Phaeobacter inhibens TaxID=221822 RepID=UPI000C9BF870|nr:Crp/Fnr family transcriptional regulator [Phaeobacter inhibens]AUQ56737.1 putative transcriptional regulator [Phaeobacter inhibens]AUQ80754.1 putative transcriptional regulator [Phaeobacter inhibens]AUR17913.1 putative transcriptional regulator [Phaeobacter inhibens]